MAIAGPWLNACGSRDTPDDTPLFQNDAANPVFTNPDAGSGVGALDGGAGGRGPTTGQGGDGGLGDAATVTPGSGSFVDANAGTDMDAGGVGSTGTWDANIDAGGMLAVDAAGSTADGGLADAGLSDGGSDGAIEVCDKVPPSSASCSQSLAPGDARKCALTVASNQRSYYLYAPRTYNPCKPTALIIDCHGALETAEAQAGIDTLHIAQTLSGPLEYPGIGSGWRLEADTPEGGFIVVTPQGIDNIWTTLNSDPEFFLAIVEATRKIANIAPDKIYMTGISNGSIISFQTACDHPEVFSGIAAFSAGQNCARNGKAIPLIAFDAEPDFAYSTTVDATSAMVARDKCTAAVNPNWLTIDSKTTDNVCRNDPFDKHPTLVPCSSITKTSITTAGIEPTVCKRWDGCTEGSAVVFCDVAPSTLHGPDNASVDAHILYGNASSLNMPSVAWRFFKSFWKK